MFRCRGVPFVILVGFVEIKRSGEVFQAMGSNKQASTQQPRASGAVYLLSYGCCCGPWGSPGVLGGVSGTSQGVPWACPARFYRGRDQFLPWTRLDFSLEATSVYPGRDPGGTPS